MMGNPSASAWTRKRYGLASASSCLTGLCCVNLRLTNWRHSEEHANAGRPADAHRKCSRDRATRADLKCDDADAVSSVALRNTAARYRMPQTTTHAFVPPPNTKVVVLWWTPAGSRSGSSQNTGMTAPGPQRFCG